eukprot:43452_1
MASFYYASIPSIAICGIIATLVGCILYYELLCGSLDNMKTLYRNCFIICTLGCVGCIYSDLVHHIYCFATNTFLYGQLVDDIFALSDVLYYIGALSFYLIAIQRIHITFGDSAYSVSDNILIFLLFLIALAGITAIYYTVRVTMMTDEHYFFTYNTVPTIILMIIDMLLNSILLFIFISKMKTVMVNSEKWQIDLTQMRNTVVSTSISPTNVSPTLSPTMSPERSVVDSYFAEYKFTKISKNLIDVIVRHTLLFSVAIITNQLFFIALVISFLSTNETWYLFVFRSIENLTNVMVLFLSIGKNKKIYYFVCKYCDKCVRKCCESATASQLRKSIYVKLDDNPITI